MADAGRVIAGSARGVRLAAPGPGTRPLADRVKQTLFAVLEPELPEAAVLDLFAGSGAAGIEALSRGATRAVFVEKDASAVRTIHENLRRTGLNGPAAEVVRVDAIAWLERGGFDDSKAVGVFDVVVVDPPYAETELLARALGILGAEASRILAPRARVVAKHFWRERPPARIGLLASERERRF
ncbi:MAG TPA: RsmD family RNA methyltransferase, partial [Candidatus Acidoferrum sp.]|nr:RsmD family RNA methyltransferase [Candidatus Acidoferrum sp.]